MFLSIFDIFKIGVGPSSSHTIGPMVAGALFLKALKDPLNKIPGAGDIARLGCRLYGSLAFTGKGHATDRAVIWGLAGFEPAHFDADKAEETLLAIQETGKITPPDFSELDFAPEKDLIFDYGPALQGHPNGMVLSAYDAEGNLYFSETYYSIGGGFVVTEKELAHYGEDDDMEAVPYPFKTSKEMLEMAQHSGLSIAEMKRRNELVVRDQKTLSHDVGRIWEVMNSCINRGLSKDGILPGGLNVRRRAKGIHQSLQNEMSTNIQAPHIINDWISVYAMAVNEENAAGGRVVTSPTNGAAGVVPAVIRYYLDHIPGATHSKIEDFLFTAAAIGGIIKTNASISGAECGCQAEVGSAAAMGAAGLCAVLGGTPEQIENAAEIALEHHLGMTCDPIKGLVQVPCIERNGLGAIKAVSAASLALRGDGKHFVSLDACVKTMLQTGQDMDEKYRETSRGGLAVNVPEC